MEPATIHAIDREILADAYTSDEAMNNLEILCEEFGGRYSGTDENYAAGEFLARRLVEYGLSNVRQEPFPHLAWERGSCSLTLTAPEPRDFPGHEIIALPHCGTHDVEAPLLFIGNGTASEFEAYKDLVPDCIVLVTARSPAYLKQSLHRRRKIRRAAELGARGMIYMRDEGGLLAETGSTVTNDECPIPVVGVSMELGHSLVRQLRRGEVRARIQMENGFRQCDLYNVVADIPGGRLKEKVVLAGAHYDGHDLGQAAMDNGSGTVVQLEAARILARHGGYGKTLRFAFFSGEEIGLLGARAYLKQHPLDELEFMINLDGAGGGSMRGIGLQGWPELIPYFRAMADEMKHPMDVDVSGAFSSDHIPFAQAGVPAMLLQRMTRGSGTRGFSHTSADTLEKVNLRDLQRPAAQIARIMLRLASRDDFPASHREPDPGYAY